jgi:AMP nucleosidase
LENSADNIRLGHGSVRNLQEFHTAEDAVRHIEEVYEQSCEILCKSFQEFAQNPDGHRPPLEVRSATYPYLGITVPPNKLNIDARHSYGIVDSPGTYGTTVTRPDIFRDYYLKQIHSLIEHHEVPVVVGVSDWPIPLPFVVDYSQANLKPEHMERLNFDFALPDLSMVNDDIANCTHCVQSEGNPWPLSLFTGERVDMSLSRLHHYTGTAPEHFQNFILLTNYQRYIGEFEEFARYAVASDPAYTAFVKPGDATFTKENGDEGKEPAHLPQMPAYHLKRADKSGITFINIGVGPSNAKTITDHLAVLRPHCWLMLGHCAGLRRSQILGDYVLAHAYVREDHVLDQDLPIQVPLPAIAEVQTALQEAVVNVTGMAGADVKTRMRTGTVLTTDNRNWELRSSDLFLKFKQNRAIAVDMESATIAANGFRLRVLYGTLLCVSDKPIHGELKVRGMANKFCSERTHQHLLIGLETIRLLREGGVTKLHSRKLRSFDDPPFQ